MRKRAVFSVARCLSFRLSDTFVYCIQTAEDIVKHFTRPGSLMILVFDPKRRYPIPRETPSASAQNTREGENFAIFD